MGGSVDERLLSLVEVMGQLRSAFDGITAISRDAGATGVEFAGHMLIGAINSFEDSVVHYVQRKTDAPEKRN